MVYNEEMKYWWIAASVVVLVSIVAGIFLLNKSEHSDIIPGLFTSKSNPEMAITQEAAKKLDEARLLLQDAKQVRIPLQSLQKQLDDAQRLFDERRFTNAVSAATALALALSAELTKEKDKPKIAITYDAGAGVGPAPDLIKYLRETRTKITLFSTGKWAEQNSGLLKQILAPEPNLPNELGNHTYNHPHLVTGDLDDEQIRDQLLRTETVFQRLGYGAKPLFRYPYGEHDSRTDAIVKELGYRVIGWSFDSLGWKRELTAEQIADRVVSKTKPGTIVLMHVGSPEDVAAFPLIVERLQAQYQFVFISEL